MGGEKLMGRPRRSVGAGSPPRRRGKDVHDADAVEHTGITPAWAGKSILEYLLFCPELDHPRVGGEKFFGLSAARGSAGSPPRGRGKEQSPLHTLPLKRITPAWAGKSFYQNGGRAGRWDHPRVGGEKCPMCQWRRSLKGSPPHGRGKVINALLNCSQCGITPAWAGKSSESTTLSRWKTDHPRMGGEKGIFPVALHRCRGSPPHGRGKVKPLVNVGRDRRITPAWAGKRSVCSCFVLLFQDHPRMGGEKSKFVQFRFFLRGSPPHGRGKAMSEGGTNDKQRITPAWAGKRAVGTVSR